MAGRAADQTKGQKMQFLSQIDPLTIDQTQGDTGGLPIWQQLTAGAYLVAPASLSNRLITSDLYVFNHLRLRDTGNGFGSPSARPVALQITADSLRAGQEHQLLVYWLAEKQAHLDAEPVLVRCLRAGEVPRRVTLLPGCYVVVIRNKLGQRCWQHVLQVP